MKKLQKKKELFPTLSMFDDFLSNFFEDETDNSLMAMPVDLIEYEDHYEVKADLPGFDKKEIKVSLKDNDLIIEAAHKETKEEKKGTYYKKERFEGSFVRKITFTEKCDVNEIDANYKNGVLTISIPKKEPKPAKEIAIK